MEFNDEQQVGKQVHQLLIEVQSSLYAFIYTLLGNGEDAHDILQEVNLAILAKEAEYDPDRNFFTWACRFAQLQVMAHRKRQSRDRLRFDDGLVQTLAAELQATLQESTAMLDALAACLDRLSPEHRLLIRQRYEAGHSSATIAKSLHITVGALRTKVFRVRRLLFDCMQQRLKSEAV